MKTVYQLTQLEACEVFARNIPNAERIALNVTRGILTVWFDGVHSREYPWQSVKGYIERFYSNGKVSIQ